ncbi:MAG: alpha/beta hydrolase [Acidobacteriota bacterium]
MSQPPTRAAIANKRLVLPAVPADRVSVTRDVPYLADDPDRTMDLYRPAGTEAQALPAVVFVTGYPDAGMRAVMGCAAKEMASYVSWAEAIAASGMVGVTYSPERPQPHALAALDHLRTHATALGIDDQRLAIWSCSGNVPTALSLLMEARSRAGIRAAVFSYGFMLDLDGATGVGEAAATFRFANPCAGKSLDELPRDLPVFLARAGGDEMPGLNRSIDAFVRAGLANDLPLTLANRRGAAHAFDILEDTAASRQVAHQILGFLVAHLDPDGHSHRPARV